MTTETKETKKQCTNCGNCQQEKQTVYSAVGEDQERTTFTKVQ